ncbi:MAG: hypothetical protein LBU89_01235 [Fibromonadaceae bacterium]|nr:hypothetical protein [Fibromonadaceae bacterium]
MLINDSISEIPQVDAFPQKTAENGNFEGVTTKQKEAYELSLSEEGWKVLGEKKSDKNDKNDNELSDEEQRKVEELKKIDQKVRAHEQAHLSAAGGHARGGANYSYVTGPDGRRYANAGYVNLDTSPEGTPEATMRKAETIRKAALAPAEPSSSDRQIAAEATKMAQEAQRELAGKQESVDKQHS